MQALHGPRLVLLVAPAGYGKTAALSRQLSLLPPGHAVAWITAGEEDDLARLLSCLVAALEPHDPPWRMAPESLAAAARDGPSLRDVAGALSNTLDATGVSRGIIVLDDLHLVADPRVFEFLDLLVEQLPSHWVMVIAARVDPPLALVRWRARRELLEFRQADLTFSMDEVAQMLRSSGGGFANADAHAEASLQLFQRTQGWAAGLCLSISASRDGAPLSVTPTRDAGNRHLFDYLAAEVFDRMSPEMRDFLMRISVLHDLTAERCCRVSGNPRAAELLEEIEREGLFVSALNDDGMTLRMHDLFKAFLEFRLARDHAAQLPMLLSSAAQGEPDPVRRCNLLLRAGAWAEAEAQVAGMAAQMPVSGAGAQIQRLIDEFPVAVRIASPQLAYARGLCAWESLEYHAMGVAMRSAALGFAEQGLVALSRRALAFEALAHIFDGQHEDMPELPIAAEGEAPDLTSEVLGDLIRFWAFAIHGPCDAPLAPLLRLLKRLGSAKSAELWYWCVPSLYIFVGRAGLGLPLRRFADGAVAAAGDCHAALETAARTLSAWLYLWRGEMDAADAEIQRILEDHRWLGRPRALEMPLLRLLAIRDAMRGDPVQVRASCAALMKDASEAVRGLNWRVGQLSLAGRLAATVEDWDGAREARRILAKSLQATDWRPQRPVIQSLDGLLALNDGRLDEAVRLLRAVVKVSADVDRMGIDGFARIHLAVAELRAGSAAAAWGVLGSYVRHVACSGEFGAVRMTAPRLLRELAVAHWGELAAPEDLAALRRWPGVACDRRPGDARLAPESAGALSVLSERELEVLRRIATGESNKLIARVLGISPHTVKRHVARILDRLELSSRWQAAIWLRAHERTDTIL